jgi:histone H3/H4
LDFNFPTPSAPAADADLLPNEAEDFILDTVPPEPETGFPSSDDDAALGDFGGFDLNIPDQVSEAGTVGAVGGGLRDAPLSRGRKEKKLSRHGIPVPNLPSGVVKRLATRFARTGTGTKTKINKETLAAIEQASEWFFEQASEDLATYAKHAGRKTMDESDVMTLMRR